MSQIWPLKKLGDVIALEYGKPLPKENRFEGGKYPAYGANGIKCRTNDSFCDKPSIIVGRKGSAGEVNLVDAGFWPLDVTYYVTFDENKHDLKFLFYMLKKLNLTSLAKGVKPGINRNDVYLIEQSFPTLQEQKRIVAILDEAFAGIDTAIANTEKNLANARELFESYLLNLFIEKDDKWSDYKLGDLCDFLNGFAFKSKDTVDASNVQLIRMGNLYQNKLDLDRKPSFYPEEFAQESERYLLNEGDLIISLTGTVDKEDYGYTVEIPRTDRALLLNQRIAKFINIDSSLVEKSFLLYLLRSRFFLEFLYDSARGVRQANLSTVAMKNLSVSLPPVGEQLEIVKNLSQLENDTRRLEIIYQQKLNSLNELKQSLLQKAFSGELTARSCPEPQEAVA